MVIPVKTGATGMVAKGLKRNLKRISEKNIQYFPEERQLHAGRNT